MVAVAGGMAVVGSSRWQRAAGSCCLHFVAANMMEMRRDRESLLVFCVLNVQ